MDLSRSNNNELLHVYAEDPYHALAMEHRLYLIDFDLLIKCQLTGIIKFMPYPLTRGAKGRFQCVSIWIGISIGPCWKQGTPG